MPREEPVAKPPAARRVTAPPAEASPAAPVPERAGFDTAQLSTRLIAGSLEQDADALASTAAGSSPQASEQQTGTPRVAANAAGSGTPIPDASRGRLEEGFGADFSGVRLHTDAEADALNRSINARAFTSGADIYFRSGEYRPGAATGHSLLAHELAHVIQQDAAPTTRAHRQAQHGAVQAQFFGPPVQSGAGSGFDDFMLQLSGLEGLAIADGYSFDQRVTAFRKIFYDSSGPARSYGGVTTGGGAWNILIPGAAATVLPPSWSGSSAASAVAYLRSHAVQTINGVQVDMGHLLAGADARRHPAAITLPGVTMRSNVQATTYTGDLGSVVVEYLYGSAQSFRDTAMDRQPALLRTKYDAFASDPDVAGDADANAIALDPAKTLAQNLQDYYVGATSPARRRWKNFAAAIGLGTFASGSFTGDNAAWRSALQGEVMAAALAYAAANGRRGDVLLVNQDPGPGVFTPTFWEAYWNISGWVVGEFVSRIVAGARTEP